MKINKQKHGKENTIGKIIYGFLMFMPLMAVLVTCAYVIFNKNAYHSYSNYDENQNQYVNVTSYNELITGRTYKFISHPTQDANLKTSANGEMNIQNLTIINTNFDFSQYDLSEITAFRVWNYNNIAYLKLVNEQNNIGSINMFSYYVTFEFEYLGYIPNPNNSDYTYNFDKYIYKNEIINQSNTLDNVFYYSIDKVEQSPLFSWATNTGTHDVLESTCQTLGITTSFVPMLLAYWLMMSLMYLLYDIALLIVHMAHNRIHDIESSI